MQPVREPNVKVSPSIPPVSFVFNFTYYRFWCQNVTVCNLCIFLFEPVVLMRCLESIGKNFFRLGTEVDFRGGKSLFVPPFSLHPPLLTLLPSFPSHQRLVPLGLLFHLYPKNQILLRLSHRNRRFLHPQRRGKRQSYTCAWRGWDSRGRSRDRWSCSCRRIWAKEEGGEEEEEEGWEWRWGWWGRRGRGGETEEEGSEGQGSLSLVYNSCYSYTVLTRLL